MNIVLSTDSTCDLPKEIVTKLNIPILSLPITLGKDTLLDGTQVSPDDIFHFVEKHKILPKTSAINEFTYTEFFTNALKTADAVIHLTISSALSLCYENAKRAADKLQHVYVIDTRTLSSGMALLLLKAQDLIARGFDAQDIATMLHEIKNQVQASFVIENLEFLHKGGRCSGLQLLGANLLKIRPSIAVQSGKLAILKKYKGKMTEVVESYIVDTLKQHPTYDPEIAFITYSSATKELLEIAEKTLRQHANFKQIYFTRASGTITSHCGKNTLGVLYLTK